MLAIEPELFACDLHPDYLSTEVGARAGARAASRFSTITPMPPPAWPRTARAARRWRSFFDGTGYGTDGTIWGGELLRCDLGGFERLAHLDPVPLPGGEAAVREPWRMAAAYLERAGRPVPCPDWPRVRESLKLNAPLSSGAGRLFDAASALLGVHERVSYEGQAAIELEQLAGHVEAEPYLCRAEDGRILGADLIACAHDDLQAGRDRAEIAAAFHEGVALAFAEACARAAEPETVVLSGGCFQNLRLLASTRRSLEERDFRVLVHSAASAQRRLHLLRPGGDRCIRYGRELKAE